MACSSTFPCPLCRARSGLLDQVGDPRTWAEIISFCEAWLSDGEDPDRRKLFGCCHKMPIIGPTSPTPVSNKVVPPPLHIELSMNKPLKRLMELWDELHLWLKSINVEEFPYHGGNELGMTPNIITFFCLWLRKDLKVSQCPCLSGTKCSIINLSSNQSSVKQQSFISYLADSVIHHIVGAKNTSSCYKYSHF